MDKELAGKLRTALVAAAELDKWHALGEGYPTLRAAVRDAIKELDPPISELTEGITNG